MWDEINEYLKDNDTYFLPLYNDEGKLQSFCYEDIKNDWWNYICANETLSQMKRDPYTITQVFKVLFPDIKLIHIHDMNEWSYILYKGFSKVGFPVIITGTGWSALKETNTYKLEDFADFSIFNVYAEGTQSIRIEKEYPKEPFHQIVDNFKFLKEVVEFATVLKKSISINSLIEIGVPVFNCRIPHKEELSTFVKSEDNSLTSYIAYLKSCLINGGENLTDDQKELLYSIYSKETCEKIAKEDLMSSYNKKCPVFLNNNFSGKIVCKEYDNKLKRRIYLIGECIVTSYCVELKDSLQYHLQKNMEDYVVVSIPIAAYDYIKATEVIKSLPIRKDDIVLFVDSRLQWKYNDKVNNIDVFDLYNDPLRKEVLYSDSPIHTNARGNKLLADRISAFIYTDLKVNESDNLYLQKGEILKDSAIKKINTYVEDIKRNNVIGTNNGAIVMNANPFTKGHLYLIEDSAKKVDTLFVFVVEEDRSYFKFEDRFRLVKEQTSHIKNVVVVSSGAFILSFNTLPIYFEKAEKQNEEIDASSDIEIFARYIAPKLNIKYRFVGEEPLDKVTNQYNMQMKMLLKEWGVNLIEIPRREIGNKVISASRVRANVEAKKWEEVKELVPEKTFEFLYKKYR
ncbi:[citrate (pro-3S)-lyase] ligase [Clostridium sp. DSM 8431]|uniref:adenylyltransferase/cytidyltransferase family protein n=1 Tax=Clostridium sp. DSM 8431 TaxID=1761781 RepID=UPI0008EEF30E|nr:adenylyltransferase/cytidyltransferase family protein [Clostridium sp. DSM 8431]SFU83903.1 [citrate (pro-3S)-lyase] ligase [Clostridium sp. DSM 8431]